MRKILHYAKDIIGDFILKEWQDKYYKNFNNQSLSFKNEKQISPSYNNIEKKYKVTEDNNFVFFLIWVFIH